MKQSFIYRLIGVLLFMSFIELLAPGPSGFGHIDEQDPDVFLPLITSSCWPNSMPIGGLPEQPSPVFCEIDNQGEDTSQSGMNTWTDDFDHELAFADFSGTDYKIFEKVGFVHKTIHWRHANHWMVDLAAHSPENPPRWVRGGALIRPEQTFRFEDGRFIVEADVAASIEGYDGNAWPELVVSTGASPYDTGSLYAYDLFPEDWTLGCRLQASRYPVCAFKNDDGDIQAGESSRRIWEMSAHQPVGTTNYGGSPFEGRGDYWRECGENDPDMLCRDRFRLELTRSSLTLYVNGNKYFEQTGVPTFPDAFYNGDLYVYFASVAVSHPAEVIRFHWDRVSVNPDTPPSAAPGFRLP